MSDFWTLEFAAREKQIKKSSPSEVLHIPIPKYYNISFSDKSDEINTHILSQPDSDDEIIVKATDPEIMKIKRQIDSANVKQVKKKRKTKAELAKEKAEEDKKIPCYFYMEGRCKKGSDCPFSHDCKVVKKPELCKYWITGGCIKGEECAYSHEKSEYPCKYYHLYNTCKYGNNCSYSHEVISDEMKQHLREVYHIEDTTTALKKEAEEEIIS